jgi:phosphatidylinositol kinase/protein kinase (PI-3  family)
MLQVHHINTLMYLLSDENFEIREEAMRVMSRLASIDPGEVLPGFRQMLLNLISEIRNSSDSRLREESVLMLCNFLRAQPLQRVVRVFMGTIIFSLPFTTDVRLTTASLQALGELCVVMRQDIASFADHLLPIIVLSMQDQSSRRKQEVAIKTMGQFVSATGLVITPYLEYPQLLPSALDLVTKHGQTTPWSLRREALRTLGLLGALEPYKFTIIEKHIEVQMKKERSSSDAHTVMIIETMKQNKSKGLDQDGGDFGQAHSLGLSTTPRSRRYSGLNSLSFTPHTRRRTKTQEDLTRTRAGSDASGLMVNAKGLLIKSEVLLDEDNGVLPAHRFMLEQCAERACSAPSDPQKERITPQNDDFYPQSAIAALMRILHDSSLSVHHSSVAQAIMLIFKSLGMHCVPFLDEIIPFLLQVLRRCMTLS